MGMMSSKGGATVIRNAQALLLTIVAVGLGVGCERWPWESATEPVQPAGGSPPSQTASPVAGHLNIPEQERLALVNQTPLSTTDVELATLELKRLVQAYNQTWQPLPAQETADALDLHDILTNLMDTELKAQDARSRGLDRRTEIQRRLAYLLRGFYAQEWDRWQRDRAVPTEEAIHQFYEQNRLGFVDPERIHLRQIVTETLADAEAARAQAIQGAVFAQLARERSVGAGKEEGGDVGWHLRAIDHERLRLIGASPTEQVVFPQLEQVAFALESGQVSQPVKGPDGRYYVVQLEERKPAKQQTELEVHDAIKELLTIQNVQKQLEQLRAKAKVESFPERLTNVQQ
jgi:parvulin-like peptidyl-prolyl isomerase